MTQGRKGGRKEGEKMKDEGRNEEGGYRMKGKK